jgi:hypothetical protein
MIVFFSPSLSPSLARSFPSARAHLPAAIAPRRRRRGGSNPLEFPVTGRSEVEGWRLGAGGAWESAEERLQGGGGRKSAARPKYPRRR